MNVTDTAVAESDANLGFGNLGLDAKLIATLTELGYEEPSPIQREAIPALLTGRDVIGQAATGTGKTAAFALPMLQRISELGKDRQRPAAMVLVPTRELCMQVAEALHKYGAKLKISVIPVYGGHSFGQQQRMLERGVDVVVATPGRAIDHIKRETLDLSGLKIIALDEADEMLDMGFADDMEMILSATPEDRQTVLFSATLPPRIAGLVKKYLNDPIRIQVAKEKPAKGAAPKVRQTAYIIPRQRKLEVLGRILDLENPGAAIVFCRTRTEVDMLAERLSAHGYRAQAMHGGITQDQRTRVVRRLREGQIDLVVATDVAARGLDIENLELVVNFDVPTSPDSYVHRIGRVGRAGREGVAITLADPRESRLLRMFEQQTKGKIELAQVPTVADLRARKLEITQAALRETITNGGLDAFRVCVETLARDHDLMDVALAAVKLLHEAEGGDSDGEDNDSFDRPAHDRFDGGNRRFDRDDARPRKYERSAHGDAGKQREPRPLRIDRGDDSCDSDSRDDSSRGNVPRGNAPQGAMSRIYVGVGKVAHILPRDLVGAIANEAGIPGNQIGAIEIADKFSIVELPEDVIENVIEALRKTEIKGRKAVVRRFVEKR